MRLARFSPSAAVPVGLVLACAVLVGGCGRSAPDGELAAGSSTSSTVAGEQAGTPANTLSPAGVQIDSQAGSAMAGARAVSDEPVISLPSTTIPLATTIPEKQDTIYVVQSGDVISGIASRHGVSMDDIRRANPNIEDIDDIKVGQELVIPAG